MVFEHGLEHGLNTVLNTVLKAVLNTILKHGFDMFSSRNTNLISMKQFISFIFYITSFFSRLILDFTRRSSFIRVNVSNSNKISEYSSSGLESSDNAFEMRLLIVLSIETANIAILSCFSIFNDSFFSARFPSNRSNLIGIDNVSFSLTAGAATIVERRSIPVIPNPIAITPKQLSITSIILTPLLYFVLSSFRLSLSAVNISCISSNF